MFYSKYIDGVNLLTLKYNTPYERKRSEINLIYEDDELRQIGFYHEVYINESKNMKAFECVVSRGVPGSILNDFDREKSQIETYKDGIGSIYKDTSSLVLDTAGKQYEISIVRNDADIKRVDCSEKDIIVIAPSVDDQSIFFEDPKKIIGYIDFLYSLDIVPFFFFFFINSFDRKGFVRIEDVIAYGGGKSAFPLEHYLPPPIIPRRRGSIRTTWHMRFE